MLIRANVCLFQHMSRVIETRQNMNALLASLNKLCVQFSRVWLIVRVSDTRKIDN